MASAAPAQSTRSDAEAKVIEALIERVAALPGVVFVRNGADAAPAAAARHLRDKYAHFRPEIATAEDFIRLCGTRSELTGRAYAVRLRDGTERPAACTSNCAMSGPAAAGDRGLLADTGACLRRP